MEVDPQGLEVLSSAQCLRLMRRRTIGRVVLSVGSLPAAFPVNYGFLDDDVVFRTAPGSKLSAALEGAVVAFQVDRIDPVLQSGWSVLVQGRAEILSDGEDLSRAARLGLRPTAPGEHPFFVRVGSEMVSGRRFVSPAQAMAESFSSAHQVPNSV